MRIESAFNTGREGLTAHGQAIAVAGDNISNANTTGYKVQRAVFADLLGERQDDRVAEVVSGAGDGVFVHHIKTNFETGPINSTGRDLDVAISGNGFFVVGSKEQPFYTRAGSFQIDKDGFLVTQDGQQVLGYTDANATILTGIDMRKVQVDPVATTEVQAFGNLSVSATTAPPPTNPTSFKDIAAADAYSTVSSVFDSLGKSHDVVVSFFKTGINNWTVQAYVNGSETGGTADQPVLVGQANLAFDSTGRMTPEAAAAAVVNANVAWGNGAAASAIAFDFGSFSQFAGASLVTNVTQNGQGSGDISGYKVGADGTLYALMGGGRQATVGTIATAVFQNNDGLIRAGSSIYAATPDAGAAAVGVAGAGPRGELLGQSLESANVDIAGEFVDLIILQRGYGANSRVISTANEIIKDTIALVR
jgi:flagellar hook protein FlgE